MDMGLGKLWQLSREGGLEAWSAAVHGVAKSRTRLSDWTDWLTMVVVMVAMLDLEMGVDGDDDGTVNENKIKMEQQNILL